MKPIELKTQLSDDMKRVKKLYSEKCKKVFFAYGLNGYLNIYEVHETNFWKNGIFLKNYFEGMNI